MTFKKGQTGNPHGRPRAGLALMERLRAHYAQNWGRVEEELKKMKGKDYIEVLVKILPKNIDVSNADPNEPFRLVIEKTYDKKDGEAH